MVLTYKKEIIDKIVNLSEIELDDTSSKLLYSEKLNLEGCTAENGVEYTFSGLKEKCQTANEVDNVLTIIQSAKTITCKKYTYSEVDFETKCYIKMNNDDKDFYEDQSLEEINIKLNNVKGDTYAPAFGTTIKNPELTLKIEENKVSTVSYDLDSFSYSTISAKVVNEGKYLKAITDGDIYFLCLESSCKYICQVEDYDSDWGIYYNPCYRKANFDSEFNTGYNTVYKSALNYDPSKDNLRRSLLEEKEEENKKEDKEGKGYYYEDLSNSYKGYFLIGDVLTIIEQTGSNAKQIKLVLKLTDKSVKLEDIDDVKNEGNVDVTASGIEPSYNSNSEEKCKSFVSLKNLIENTQCNVMVDNFFDYSKREYNITESEGKKVLTIYDMSDYEPHPINTITFEEYDSTKLSDIIKTITSYTRPIPDNKCVKENTTSSEGEDVRISLYNKVFYINSNKAEEKSKSMKFRFNGKNDDTFYNNIYNNYFASINDNQQYLFGNTQYFYHKYVDFKGKDYPDCNEQLKNDALKEFENRINEIREVDGIQDDGDNGSVEYMVSIFLLSLLLIIFI